MRHQNPAKIRPPGYVVFCDSNLLGMEAGREQFRQAQHTAAGFRSRKIASMGKMADKQTWTLRKRFYAMRRNEFATFER